MKTITKIFQVFNLIIFLLLVFGMLVLLGKLTAVLATTLGIIILIVFPILIGVILTVIDLIRNRKNNRKTSLFEKVLAAFPFLNILILALFFFFITL